MIDIKKFFPKNLNLSPTDEKIYKYIVKYPEKMQYITIEKVAGNLHTSVASVQRFCKKMGYSGFKEFKFQLKSYLINNSHHSNSEQGRYLNEYISVVKQFNNIDKKGLSLLKKALHKSDKIFSFGLFYSGLPAKMLAFTLIDQDKTAFGSDNLVNISHLMPLYSKNDTLILFSITGEENDINTYINDNIQKSDNSFLITFNPDASIKKYFRHTIVLPGKSFAYRSPIDPQSLFCLFIEMLTAKEE
ncbi:DNA-binding MurR/RpiR family transcriptional regulator [Lactobacillus colini]|uniref:DNA-binding MurR/RpiR family transcriptional regulator n=1 Tax=Lactobacillus colini TaxID=1819254 RepID=A0ABS4MG35_9LACO|nr:MurR/RpiR family transcriptional regulator [Lactobacillus colini]MBP2058656.1 DNA-binding MurR/RpiR family transcriptional regulator [Lactobacillus colini]